MALQGSNLAYKQEQASPSLVDSHSLPASSSPSSSPRLRSGSPPPVASVSPSHTVDSTQTGRVHPPPRDISSSGDFTHTQGTASTSLVATSSSLPVLHDTVSATSLDHPLDHRTASSLTSPLTSSPDTWLHTVASLNLAGLDTTLPSSELRLRKAATQRRTQEPESGSATSLPAHTPKQHTMFGSTPTASYLPLNARQVGPSTSSYLISWIAKHKMFVILLLVAMIVSVQILFVAPILMDMEPVKKLKAHGWPSLKPPKWFGPSSESPDSWFPSSGGDPLTAGHVEPLGPYSFPPALSQVNFIGSPPSQVSLYKDTNPHRGELPTYLESLLNREPVHQPPPWPLKAPTITPEIWQTRVWNDRSTTEPSDAEEPQKQPQESDWRHAPWNGWKPPIDDLAKPSQTMPKVQYAFEDPTKHSGRRNDPARDQLVAHRQKMVRNAFIHAWEGYKKYAWGHDELRPVSKTAEDPFNGWGASIVDALDTLLVMGMPKQYDLARQHVRDIDFRLIGGGRSAYGTADGRIPVFETAIRYLGGFISAYDLSGDVLMRDRAEELAQLILPAFDTVTGVPIGRIRMVEPANHPYKPPQSQSSVILAEAGSLLLEFTRLWQVTGNRTYFDRVQRSTDWLDRNMTAAGRMESLFPTQIYPERNISYGTVSFGGMADSYYEYLIKEHQLLGGRLSQYSRMYSEAIEGAKKLLITRIDTVPGVSLMTIGEIANSRYTAKLEHLACFSGGMLGLGSRIMAERAQDIDLAKGITGTCWWAYNSSATGIGPENLIFYENDDNDRFDLVNLSDGTSRRGKPRGNPIVGVRSVATSYLNRPETIESVFYMWRITGDPIWQERGWQMFASWVTHCMTDAGFSAIYDVNSSPASWMDSMESFTFAETFKYYYLLFSPPELISLDEYVFTTEAHPLLVPQNGKWASAGHGSKTFWDANASEDTHLPWPTSGAYSGGERGQVGGLTNNQKQMLWTQWQSKNSAHKIRDLITGLGGDALKNKLRSLVDLTSPAASKPSTTQTEQQDSAKKRTTGDLSDRLSSSIAEPSMNEAADKTLAVKSPENTDSAVRQAVIQQLKSHHHSPDADSAPQLLHWTEAVEKVDEKAERKAQEQAMHLARLRSKGIR